VNNVQLLMNAGLIVASNLPDAASMATINSLSQADVQALIRIFQAVGSPFLVNNCNPGGTVAPSPTPGQRTIGIVF
jgi:hypothetical protein